MRYLLLTAAVYVAAVVQTSLVDAIRIGRVEPDVLAMVAIIWLFWATGPRSFPAVGFPAAGFPAAGFLVAGGIGLLADLISPGRIGLGAACYVLVGYAVDRLRPWLGLEHLLGQLLTVWVGVTLLSVGQTLGLWLLGDVSYPLGSAMACALGVGLYTAGVSLPVLMVAGWVREPYLARRKRLRE